ncbi:hypothetical protein LXL04_026644 [Taraxacum kok-saghyz]
MMEKNTTKAKGGDSIRYMLLPFTVRMRDDPLDYIREAKAAVDTKTTIYTLSILDLLLKLLGIKAASFLSHKMFTNTTWVDHLKKAVDENTIQDPHKLLDDLQVSLKLMKQAVYAKGLVKEEEEEGNVWVWHRLYLPKHVTLYVS